jgi:hypothetical protein
MAGNAPGLVDSMTGPLLLAHEGEKILSVELLGLAFNHPNSHTGWMQNWLLLAQLRADLEAELGAEAHQAAWERGKSLDLDATARTLLAHWGVPAKESAPAVSQPLVIPSARAGNPAPDC